ncbi:MAG TPA: YIP1 family protein [Gemmatimonadales bacterium]
MTESTATASRPSSSASAFEDYVDILYAPSAVFARRRDASPWVPLLIMTGLFAIATYINFKFLGSVYEAEAMRQAMKNPQVTAEMAQGMRRFAWIGFVMAGLTTVPFTTLVLGFLLWMVGKLLDAEQPLRAAFLVIVFSFVPRVLESLLMALQAFAIDVNAVASQYGITFSAARFMSSDTPAALLALASRLNPFVIWSYVIVAIGLAVTGRIGRGRAAIAAFVLWLVGALPLVIPALMAG